MNPDLQLLADVTLMDDELPILVGAPEIAGQQVSALPEPRLRIYKMDPLLRAHRLEVYYDNVPPSLASALLELQTPTLLLYRLRKKRRKRYFDYQEGEFAYRQRPEKWNHPISNNHGVIGRINGNNHGSGNRDLFTEWALPHWWTPTQHLPGFVFDPLSFYTYQGRQLLPEDFPMAINSNLHASGHHKGNKTGKIALFHFRFAGRIPQTGEVVIGPPSTLLRTFPIVHQGLITAIGMTMTHPYIRF